MNKDDFIGLIYKNLKGELSADEFTLLNQTTAESEKLALIRLEIEEAWDISGSPDARIDEKEIERAYSKLNKRIYSGKSKSSLRFIILATAASLLILFTGYSLLYEGMTSFTAGPQDQVFTLADNSEVSLRSGSSIEMPKNFKQRNIKLQGEAYFKVTKDENRPFVVTCNSLNITVLGTEFLVKEIPDSNTTYVSVDEGRVAVSDKTSSKILHPDMLIKYREGSFVPPPSLENLSSWKFGVFKYNDKRLTEVIEELHIIFGKSIYIENDAMKTCTVTGIIQGKTLEAVLSKIAKQLEMQVQKNPDSFLLKGGQCF